MPVDRRENLRPVRTKEEARERGTAGGKKSGKVRREKKLLSQIFADILADQSGIAKGKGIKGVAQEILNNSDPKNNSSRVALLKTIGELTEGQKLKLGNDPENPLFSDDAAKALLAKHGIKD